MDQSNTVSDLMSTFSKLAAQYNFITYGSIGKTILQNEIPYLQIGKGAGNVLLLGGANAADCISEMLLLRFAEDLCQQIAQNKKIYGISCSYLYNSRSIWIVPRLNPDGNTIAKNGADPACPLYERQLRINQMKNDFSDWQGNARGVIPTLNFPNDFANRRQSYLKQGQATTAPCGEFPESEPESASLSRLIHTVSPVCFAEFAKGDGKIFSYNPALAKTASKLTGLPVSDASDEGVVAWFASTYHRPALCVGCPDKTTTDLSLYNTMRTFLFRLPTLFRIQ